jgi:metal-responsive CopG/Arc/MetJ family transcriptional regulator
MSTAKVTISIDQALLKKVDGLVKARRFHSRSHAIQTAIQEKITRIDKSRLARECSKLNKAFEQALADEGLDTEIEEWPEY